jgi:hypothetical protein
MIKIAYSPKFLDASALNHLSHLWSRSLIFPSYHHFLWLNSYPPQRQKFFRRACQVQFALAEGHGGAEAAASGAHSDAEKATRHEAGLGLGS